MCQPRSRRGRGNVEDGLLDCRCVQYRLPTTPADTDHEAAGLSIGVGVIRVFFPESQQFIDAKRAGHQATDAASFWRETKAILAQEWKMCLYCVLLMTWVCQPQITTKRKIKNQNK